MTGSILVDDEEIGLVKRLVDDEEIGLVKRLVGVGYDSLARRKKEKGIYFLNTSVTIHVWIK